MSFVDARWLEIAVAANEYVTDRTMEQNMVNRQFRAVERAKCKRCI